MIKNSKNIFIISLILLYTIFSNFSIVFGKDSLYTNYDIGFPTVSENIAVIDMDTNLLLFEKNSSQKVYPASTTKIMTALILLENVENLYTERIYFTSEAVDNLELDASVAGMNDGDSLLAIDALYALLLPSANDVANAIALHISGNLEDFGVLMTERAIELGCENTNFTNPSGLHDDNHYTTAYDIALIMAEVSKYEEFLKISQTETYDIPPTETEEKVRTINNTNRLVLKTSSYYDDRVVGAKTGYTSKAEYTLVTYAKEDNKNIIVSTLYSTNYDRFEETTKLLNFTFDSYIDVAKNSIALPILYKDLDRELYSKVSISDISLSIPDEISVDELGYVTTLNKELLSPIEKGTTIGSLDIYYEDKLLSSQDLVVTEPIDTFLNFEYNKGLSSLSYLDNGIKISPISLIVVGSIALIFIIFFIYINLFYKKKRRRKRIRNRIYAK